MKLARGGVVYSPNRVTLSGIKSEYLDGTVTMGEAIDQLLRALLARFAPKRVPMTPIMRDISPFSQRDRAPRAVQASQVSLSDSNQHRRDLDAVDAAKGPLGQRDHSAALSGSNVHGRVCGRNVQRFQHVLKRRTARMRVGKPSRLVKAESSVVLVAQVDPAETHRQLVPRIGSIL